LRLEGKASKRGPRKPLLPLIVEKVWNGGFSVGDVAWKPDCEKIRRYTLSEILEACEMLVERGLIKEREDGSYIPAV